MNKKVVYLTIDDAPSSFMKEKVDILCNHGISAIWYLRGEFIAKHMDLVVYAIEKGFWVGNHSYSHPYFSKITLEEAYQEILRTEDLLEKAYALSGKIRPHKLFRFPFMDDGQACSSEHRSDLQLILEKIGFVSLRFDGVKMAEEQQKIPRIDAPWTFDAKEWVLFSLASMEKHGLFSIEDFVARMQKALFQSSEYEIVLFHDFETTHHLFLPLLLSLVQEGVEFALPELALSTDNKL